VSLAGATVNLRLLVNNPNSQGISLAESDYKLSVAGKQAVAGKPAAGRRIPGGGSSEVVLPPRIRFRRRGRLDRGPCSGKSNSPTRGRWSQSA